METFGIEADKDPPKGVMRGDAIGQVEKLLQPPLFAVAKEFHVLESVTSDHDGPQGNDDEVEIVISSRVSAYGGIPTSKVSFPRKRESTAPGKTWTPAPFQIRGRLFAGVTDRQFEPICARPVISSRLIDVPAVLWHIRFNYPLKGEGPCS